MKPRGTTPFTYTGARQYTLQDGLAGMLIEDVHQDRRGLLWIATADGGVSRFDGEAFQGFRLSDRLPHLTVMTIAEDVEGRLWFGTLGGGLAAFDGRGVQVYTTEHGLPSDEILGLRPQADGSMGVLTGAGLGRFADGECVDCTTEIGGRPVGRVHDMVTDSTGTTLLATRDRGIISLDGRCLSPCFEEGGAYHSARKLARDASGHLWIASRHRREEAVVGRYDPRSRHLDWIEVTAPFEVARIVRPGIRHLRLDDKGRLWMVRRGVLVYDGREWHPFSARFPDADFWNTRLTYEDREGNIWVGSHGGGLVFCQVDRVRGYTQADGLPHHRVRSLAEDPAGRIWIGTGRGVACLQGERIRSMRTGRAISALAADRGGVLWAGDRGGKVSRGEVRISRRSRCSPRTPRTGSRGCAWTRRGDCGSAPPMGASATSNRTVSCRCRPLSAGPWCRAAKAPSGSARPEVRPCTAWTGLIVSTRAIWPGWKGSRRRDPSVSTRACSGSGRSSGSFRLISSPGRCAGSPPSKGFRPTASCPWGPTGRGGCGSGPGAEWPSSTRAGPSAAFA